MAEKNNTIDAELLLRELQGSPEKTLTVKDLFTSVLPNGVGSLFPC